MGQPVIHPEYKPFASAGRSGAPQRPAETRKESVETMPVLFEELPEDHNDSLMRCLHRIIRLAVKFLAILMVLVIIWGIGDVLYVLYQRLVAPPFLLLNINDIFETFGAFMAVLIAIEIFINIRLYLGTSSLPVYLVIATALMAIARKVIVLDLDKISPEFVYGIAAVVLALGITYWLVSRKNHPEKKND